MCTFPAMTQERDACPRPITRAGVPASWYPGMAARRARMRVLAAMTTPGRFRATLDVKDRHHHRRVRDVTDTDHQAAPDGQRTPARAGGAGRRLSARWTRRRDVAVSPSSVFVTTFLAAA